MSEPRPKYNIEEGYVEVRGEGDQLLFRFDPMRDLIEIKQRNGRLHLVDLRPYRQPCELVFIGAHDNED